MRSRITVQITKEFEHRKDQDIKHIIKEILYFANITEFEVINTKIISE